MIDVMDRETTVDLEPGARVEVLNNFDGRWSRGFVVSEATESGYIVTRVSDGALLPEFGADEVRPERKRRDMWWM